MTQNGGIVSGISPPAPAGELESLLSRVRLGDREAFAALYRQTRARLLGVVLRIQKDRALAEDILQDVYVNAWRAAASFDATRSRALTWLVAIARNRAIDGLRRRAAELPTTSATVHGAEGEEDAGELWDRVASEDEGPAEALARHDDARRLARCMRALSAEQRQSIALAYFDGLSHGEIAAHMAQPLGTVKSWVRRGLVALQRCLGAAQG
jgi:RNA polymerase sigma-70 factor (ECF subfamily)